MKTTLLLFLQLLIFSVANAQQNLVPNPSFEDTVYCPNATNQLDACQNWLNFGNSPDYFNACEANGLNVPNSSYGFQYAHSGVGMVGLAIYVKPQPPIGFVYKEFVGVKLNLPLNIGQRYYFSFFTNFSAQLPIAVACNKIGLTFSTVQYDSCCHPPINNFAHLYTDSILQDSINWIRLSGSFLADSAYQFIGIGNYFDDNNTDTINIGNIPFDSYYYIDDVCVTMDSSYNELWTGIKEPYIDKEIIKIFPNPSSNFISIEAPNTIQSIIINDIQGRTLMFFNSINSINKSLDITNMSIGYYFIKVITKNSIITKLIFINH